MIRRIVVKDMRGPCHRDGADTNIVSLRYGIGPKEGGFAGRAGWSPALGGALEILGVPRDVVLPPILDISQPDFCRCRVSDHHLLRPARGKTKNWSCVSVSLLLCISASTDP